MDMNITPNLLLTMPMLKTIVKSLHDDLVAEIPREGKSGDITFMTNGAVYYPPDGKYNFNPSFVVRGTKQAEIYGHYWIAGMRRICYDLIARTYFRNVFYKNYSGWRQYNSNKV